MSKRHTLLDITGHLTPEPRVHYINHTFDVGPQASRVGLVLTFHKEKLAQIFVSLHDPVRFRGNRMNPGARGAITLELWAAPDDSSEGGVAGDLPGGQWRVQIDVEQLGESTDYRLLAYAEYEAVPPALTWDFPDDLVVRDEAGWYQGELHAHSTESDGKYPVDTVVRAAVATGLDFFALTDHFTTSQWRKLVPHLEQPIALLRSTEITSHQGHANLHGMQDWVDVYVDRDDWSMNQAAAAIHAQNGLFCVNHPFSGSLGWRAYDFDWANADLIEIYHNLEGGNNAYQLALWDRLLNQGYRIVGVGGIDSHDPFEGFHRLGQLVTWVYADHLSEAGIVAGLKRGRAYVSKGPELRFTARDGAQSAEMWESLPLGEVTLEVAVRADEDLRLYVLRDGLPFDSVPLMRTHGRWTTLTFHDQPQQRAYYRVELHSQYHDPTFPYLRWRDHTTMRALSNPIWVE